MQRVDATANMANATQAGIDEPLVRLVKRSPYPPMYDFVPVVMVLLFLSTQPRPSFPIRLSAWLAVLSVVYAGLQCETGDILNDYLTALNLVGTLFMGCIFLLLSDPVQEFRHETQKPGEEIADMPFWKRLYMVACLFFSHRGIGWNYQIAHLPPAPTETRWRFVVKRTLRVVRYLFLLDMCHVWMDLDPMFAATHDAARAAHRQRPGLLIFDCFVYIMMCYFKLSVPYDCLAAVSVALGFNEPKVWPVIYGHWLEAYTVRRFWGRKWHQYMRRFASGFGKSAARSLGCTKGSWLSSHVQLFVAFFATGLAHAIGDYMGDPTGSYLGVTFPFFLWQAVAITIEDFVIDAGRKRGIQETYLLRILGYVWTATWMVYTNVWFIAGALEYGVGSHRVFRQSIVHPLLEIISKQSGLDVKSWITAKL